MILPAPVPESKIPTLGDVSSKNQYREFHLGSQSRQLLLKNLTQAIGYQFSEERNIPGLSGLRYTFDAIGKRNKNILLVVGGAENQALREQHQWDPRSRMEIWRDHALLSAYDVQSALQQDGLIVDLMFFHNINHTDAWVDSDLKPHEWLEKNHIPSDTGMSHMTSSRDIPMMSNDELTTVAQSVGACFLSLDDLQLEEISLLTNPSESASSLEKVREILLRHRVLQYFQPPTDELILSGYSFSKRQDKEFLTTLKQTSEELGHPSVQNVLVSNANFLDPVETAKALENHKYIAFESKVEITESGRRVSQSIRKTAQGSFVVRILKNIGLAELARSIIEAIKGTWF